MMVREAVFARQGWYPASREACEREAQRLLTAAAQTTDHEHLAVAAIVPHAGWRFSGAVAAASIAALGDDVTDCVMIFGGHMRPGQRPRLQIAGSFDTPLGAIDVDDQIATELASRFDAEIETADNFLPDNSIELQLPFIKQRWPRARIVAMAVGADRQAKEIGCVAAQLSREQGRQAVALGSTDLTHYGENYDFCPQGVGEAAHRWSKEINDRGFLDALLGHELDTALEHALDSHSACCPGAALAAASFAAELGGSETRLLKHITSHEVMPDHRATMWVGYASLIYRVPPS